MNLTRRDFFPAAVFAVAASMLPRWSRAALGGVRGWSTAVHDPGELQRLREWVGVLRAEKLASRSRPLGPAVARVGELALGSPYAPGTLDEYLSTGTVDLARAEPLVLSLLRFDCVTLVESCVAVARLARRRSEPTWQHFGRAIATLRYRDGRQGAYPSRLHYFSDWIDDNSRRGTVRELGRELGGVADPRPLRFMTTHRGSYPALKSEAAFDAIALQERRLDDVPRRVIPTVQLDELAPRFRTGDVLAFATAIDGLDVTHTGLAWRDPGGVLRVLHAPLSGGVVQTSPGTLRNYVAGLTRSTGILAARPLPE